MLGLKSQTSFVTLYLTTYDFISLFSCNARCSTIMSLLILLTKLIFLWWTVTFIISVLHQPDSLDLTFCFLSLYSVCAILCSLNFPALNGLYIRCWCATRKLVTHSFTNSLPALMLNVDNCYSCLNVVSSVYVYLWSLQKWLNRTWTAFGCRLAWAQEIMY